MEWVFNAFYTAFSHESIFNVIIYKFHVHFTFDHRTSKLFIFKMPNQKRKKVVVSMNKKLEAIKKINNGESYKKLLWNLELVKPL